MVEMENLFYNLFSLVGHHYETALPPSLPCSDETMQPPLLTVTGNSNITIQHAVTILL